MIKNRLADSKLANASLVEASRILEGKPIEAGRQPVILQVQPVKFTEVPRQGVDLWREHFFGARGIKLDTSRFDESGTVSWCESRGPGGSKDMWPCDCDI